MTGTTSRSATGGSSTVEVGWLVDGVCAVLQAAGVPTTQARTVARSLVDSDRRGQASHGVMLVPMYLDRIRCGSVSTATSATTVVDVGAVAVLDAQNALGQITGDQAMGLAVSKAAEFGVGAVAVRHAFHFGAAGRYVRRATDAGCVGIAAANTRPLMPAPGGAEAVVGNNPLAIGVPRAGQAPIILDMALSEAALGKIRLAAAEGRRIPMTWAADAQGRPTADPVEALAGLLLPTAGHKGYGLALMVEMLTGALSGGAVGRQVRGLYSDTEVPNDCAHFFLAIQVEHMAGEEAFSQRVEDMVSMIATSRRAAGVDALLLPGQLEDEREADAGSRVRLDSSVLGGLRSAAAEVGVVLPEPVGSGAEQDGGVNLTNQGQEASDV